MSRWISSREVGACYSLCMRTVSLFSIAFLLLISLGVRADAQTLSGAVTSNLSVGSSGPQVIALQRILNLNADTQIATAGQGSPGNETPYFGSLTRAAVIRFQQKYAAQILAPAGLSQANGFVGSYTRTMLNAVSLVAASKANSNPAVTTPSTTTSPPAISAATTTSNPNLQNASQFLAIIDSAETKKGVSSSAIDQINQAVLQQLATTTDLRAAFLKQARTSTNQSLAMSQSLFSKTLTILGNALDSVFGPEQAYAQAAAGTPFGGALIFPFYCNESFNWLITLTPLPPSYAVLLSYTPFTEAFLSYNLPYASDLLGFYDTGDGDCVFGFGIFSYDLPTEGLIEPIVGSSPS